MIELDEHGYCVFHAFTSTASAHRAASALQTDWITTAQLGSPRFSPKCLTSVTFS